MGYEGGNLVLLGHHSAAEEILRKSLVQLEPTRLKHRCTLSTDLATALVHREEIEEACMLAMEALTLATVISHQESIERVRRVHFACSSGERTPLCVSFPSVFTFTSHVMRWEVQLMVLRGFIQRSIIAET